MKKISKVPLKALALMAILAAISIILGKYLAIGIGEVLRFSFENLPIIFAGLIFGPLGGAAVGVVADLVGCVLVGYTINPIITIGAAVIGALSGLFRILFMRNAASPYSAVKIALTVILSHTVGSVIIKTFGLAAYYDMPFFILMLWRLLNYLIVGGLEAVLLYFLLKNKAVRREMAKFSTTAEKR